MSSLGKLWAWLSKPGTRSVLAFLGAGLAAVVAALWQAYLHFAPSPVRAPPTSASPALAGVDVAGARRLEASDQSALNAEADALDTVTRQIEAAGSPPPAAAGARH